MKREFLISLFLHVAVLGIACIPGCGSGGSGDAEKQDKQIGDGEQDKRDIVPKGSPSSSPMMIEIVEFTKPKSKDKGEDCPYGQWFGGIGIYEKLNVQGRLAIDQVIDGYPAQKAGLKVDDVIISPSSQSIRGEPGTEFQMVVQRQGTILYFTIVRDKICVK